MGARLSIDFWHTTTAAAVRTVDGRVVAVAVDGVAVSPTGVAVDPDGTLHAGSEGAEAAAHDLTTHVRVPGHHLLEDRINVGTAEIDPVDLVSTVLAKMARAARAIAGDTPSEVVISTPAGWVARQRRAMMVAADRAGLVRPRVVTGADSIVREALSSGADPPEGSIVVVCRLDATVGELVVGRREAHRLDILATFDLGELGETPGAALSEQAAAALPQMLDAAGISGQQVAAVLCLVPVEAMARLSRSLTESAGLAVTPTLVGELVAAFGGARSGALDLEVERSRPRRGSPVTSGFVAVFAWSAAALLTYQVLSTSMVYADASESWLHTQMYAWGWAPVFVLLGATALSVVLADLRGPASPDGGSDPVLGSALLLAAATGTVAAGALSLFGAQYFGTAPGQLLRWTLSMTVPLAAVVGGLGLLVARVPAPRTPLGRVPWRDRMRFPLASTILAAVSIVAVVASYVGVPAVEAVPWWKMEHLGAYFMGWSAALLLATDPWRRVILGFTLSVAAVNSISIDTAGAISVCAVAAVTFWWLQRLAPALIPVLRRPATGG